MEPRRRRCATEARVSDVTDKVLIDGATLEALGLRVDPAAGRLREVPLLPYHHSL